MTSNAASALIVIGPWRRSRLNIANCVARSPDRREQLVVELRHMPRGLPDRQTIALGKPGLHR